MLWAAVLPPEARHDHGVARDDVGGRRHRRPTAGGRARTDPCAVRRGPGDRVRRRRGRRALLVQLPTRRRGGALGPGVGPRADGRQGGAGVRAPSDRRRGRGVPRGHRHDRVARSRGDRRAVGPVLRVARVAPRDGRRHRPDRHRDGVRLRVEARTAGRAREDRDVPAVGGPRARRRVRDGAASQLGRRRDRHDDRTSRLGGLPVPAAVGAGGRDRCGAGVRPRADAPPRWRCVPRLGVVPRGAAPRVVLETRDAVPGRRVARARGVRRVAGDGELAPNDDRREGAGLRRAATSGWRSVPIPRSLQTWASRPRSRHAPGRWAGSPIPTSSST